MPLDHSGLQVQLVEVTKIYSDAQFNCRGEIIPFDVLSLAQSIKSKGLLEPINIRPKDTISGYDYHIVTGHRRYAAFRQLAEKYVPCFIRTNLTDEEAAVLNIIENLERKDLNLLQQATSLMKFKLAGKTIQEVAKLINMSQGWVQVRYKLLELPVEIQNEAAAGFISGEQIKQLGTMTRDDQFATVRAIKDSKLRGEKAFKIKSKNGKKKKPNAKKIRGTVEIEEMQDMIRDGVGNNIATRALGWAAGFVTDMELLQSIKQHADENDIVWSIPMEYIAEIK